jgi:ribA/ribD-fused uncharacterized protein
MTETAAQLPVEDKYLFFWGGVYSQWLSSEFTVDGMTYNTAEQYMMAEKARLFNDATALGYILKTRDPSRQKAIGRTVQDFDPVKWNEVCRLVVYRANLAKFTQSKFLLNELMSTGNQIIVEASPEDTIWGIGLGETDPRRFDETQWRGKNWLGIAIMQVRSDLRQLSKVMK